MQLLKYGAIFLAVIASTYLLGWLPDRLLHPIQKHEVKALHYASNYGPGGLDDGIQGFILEKPERYAGTLLYILKKSERDGHIPESAVFLMEFVINEPGVRDFLSEYATSVTDPSDREFLETMLSLPRSES